MLKLKIESKGFDKSKKEVMEKLQRVLMKSMFKMEELAIQKAPVDTGFLRQNITLFPHILSNKYVLTSNAEYSAAMEYGTRPFYAPVSKLSKWAGRKFGDADAGFAIQNKIAKYGITAQPFMRPAFYEVMTFWQDKYKKQEFG